MRLAPARLLKIASVLLVAGCGFARAGAPAATTQRQLSRRARSASVARVCMNLKNSGV